MNITRHNLFFWMQFEPQVSGLLRDILDGAREDGLVIVDAPTRDDFIQNSI